MINPAAELARAEIEQAEDIAAQPRCSCERAAAVAEDTLADSGFLRCTVCAGLVSGHRLVARTAFYRDTVLH